MKMIYQNTLITVTDNQLDPAQHQGREAVKLILITSLPTRY